MKKALITIIIIHLFVQIKAQNSVVCRISPHDPNAVNIKWYSPKLVYKEGVNVYRKELNEIEWIKLNSSPIKRRMYKINTATFEKDKELADYVQMADNSDQLTGIALLAVMLKSFKSEDYSNYLGIQYDDKTVVHAKTYQYKVQELNGSSETLIAISSPIEIKPNEPIVPPKNIVAKIKRHSCLMRWEPEPVRYFGVNIYRHSSENKIDIQLNKEPFLLSKTKNKEGVEGYPEVFFEDKQLEQNTTYFYTFKAMDFFGEESSPSDLIAVFIKDTEAPTAPQNLRKIIHGKNVKLTWAKSMKEKDLAGFNIYRTNYSDSDYVKLNPLLIPVNDSTYTDDVPKFKQYFYRASTVDKDNNEALSVPLYADVFDNEPPAAPKNLRIIADTGLLYLQWDANSEPDLIGYLIYRTINKNNKDNYVLITPLPVNQNSFADDLPDNAKNNFLYRIVAVDYTYNKSGYSEPATSKMPDKFPPSPPLIKQAVQNKKQEVIIEWLPNTEPDLVGYNIYRKTLNDSASVFEKQNSAILNQEAYKFTDRYTINNRSYEYYLTACDSSGNTSRSSNHFKFHTNSPHETLSAVFTSFKANYDEKKKSVEIYWNTSSKDLKFILYRKKGKEKLLFPSTGVLNDHRYSDQDIKKDQTYHYQVRGYSNTGDVLYSEIIKITTK